MKWKSTLVLVLLVIGAGFYVSLYELRQPLPEQREARATQPVRIEPPTVTGLALTIAGHAVALQRAETGWRLLLPTAETTAQAPEAAATVSVRADSELIERALDRLDPLRAERVLTGVAPADYGLDPPQGRLTVTAASETVTLRFGEATAIGHARYAQREDRPDVYVIDGALYDELNQPAESFRARDLFGVDLRRATRVAISSEQASYALRREPSGWRLEEPVNDATNSNTVSVALNKLQEVRAERFINDRPAPEELARWGLEPAAIRILLTMEDGSAPVEVRIGVPTADNAAQRYAKRADEPTVAAVPDALLPGLLPDPQTFRATACFDFFTVQAGKARVEGPRGAWTIEKVGDGWRDAEDQSALDAAKVEDWLTRLREETLVRFLDDAPQDLARYGLATPEGSIAVWTVGREQPHRVDLGGLIEGTTSRYGRIDGRSSVVELPDSLVALWMAPREALRPSPSAPEAGAPSPGAPPSP